MKKILIFIMSVIIILTLGACSKTYTCEKCGGDGKTRCLQCNATGKSNGGRCMYCAGVGIFKCNLCNGSGKLTEEQLPKVEY